MLATYVSKIKIHLTSHVFLGAFYLLDEEDSLIVLRRCPTKVFSDNVKKGSGAPNLSNMAARSVALSFKLRQASHTLSVTFAPECPHGQVSENM